MTIPAMMKCVEIRSFGGPEVLAPAERPVPRPGIGEVLIRVIAAGVNRPDVLQRMGLYPPPEGVSDLPGLEVAGEIVAVGADVAAWRPGDQACALLGGGGYAEYAVADHGACLPVPQGLSPVEAASLPETFFTVYANVFETGDLKPGERLLVHGGSSGIGVTAISIAKAMGAKVIASASSESKLSAIRQLGADATFNYNDEDWEKSVETFGGADVVLDMAGGDFFARNLACLNPGGRHVSIAFLRGAEGRANIREIMRKRLTISGSTMKARPAQEKARLAAQIRSRLWPLIESGRIRPVIDRVFPLAEAAKAHARMESGAHIGKIVLSAAPN